MPVPPNAGGFEEFHNRNVRRPDDAELEQLTEIDRQNIERVQANHIQVGEAGFVGFMAGMDTVQIIIAKYNAIGQGGKQSNFVPFVRACGYGRTTAMNMVQLEPFIDGAETWARTMLLAKQDANKPAPKLTWTDYRRSLGLASSSPRCKKREAEEAPEVTELWQRIVDLESDLESTKVELEEARKQVRPAEAATDAKELRPRTDDDGATYYSVDPPPPTETADPVERPDRGFAEPMHPSASEGGQREPPDDVRHLRAALEEERARRIKAERERDDALHELQLLSAPTVIRDAADPKPEAPAPVGPVMPEPRAAETMRARVAAPCPDCGVPMKRWGKTRLGKQRFRCKEPACGRRTVVADRMWPDTGGG